MKELKAFKLPEINNLLGEGPIWDEISGCLYWVDIRGNKIGRYNLKSRELKSLKVESYPSTIILTTRNSMLVTALDCILEIPLEAFDQESTYPSKKYSELGYCENEDITRRFNDGKADPSGRLWLGSMAIEEDKGNQKGSLYCLGDIKSPLEVKINETTISNGMCWDTKRSLFYFIDTPTKKVGRYHWEPLTGKIEFIDYCISSYSMDESLKEGFPDGMTIDGDGNLWVAYWNGHQVVCYDPNTGKQLYRIHIDALNVTCPTFGGSDLKTLFITTAKDSKGLGGELFVVELDVTGTLSNRTSIGLID